jgi:hypothetical protein
MTSTASPSGYQPTHEIPDRRVIVTDVTSTVPTNTQYWRPVMSVSSPEAPAGSNQLTGAPAPEAPSISLVAAARKRALWQIVIGIAFLVGGIIVTAVTYHDASTSQSGGTYIVAWGPIAFGLIALVRGVRALGSAGRLR